MTRRNRGATPSPVLALACSAAALAVLAAGCGPKGQPAAAPAPAAAGAAAAALLAGGRTVDAGSFEITLPPGWELRPDAVVAVNARPRGGRLHPSLKVAVLKPPAGAGVNEVVGASKAAYARIWRVEREGPAALGAGRRPAHRMVLREALPPPLPPSRQLKYFVQAGPRVLIITGLSVPADFDAHLPLFEAVAASLRTTRK